MMTDFVDGGQRCSDHVGEAFPPRCSECEALNETSRPVGAGQLDRTGTNEPWAPMGSFPDPWSTTLPDPWG